MMLPLGPAGLRYPYGKQDDVVGCVPGRGADELTEQVREWLGGRRGG
jgi:hypothetical protein